MSKLKEYKQYFKPDEVPEALVKLIEFDEGQRGWYSHGFELQTAFDDVGLKTYSDKPEFLNSLFEIAQATSSGSTYAIWRQSGDLSDAPILAFGDEGGVHVVAENLLGLLRILTLDVEPSIDWDRVYYYKADDFEPTPGAADYAAWLAKNFKLKPVKDADEVATIIKNAQEIHEAAFQKWLKQFCE